MAEDYYEDEAAFLERMDAERAADARREWLWNLAIIGPMVALTAFFGVLAILT
jgi:hypothetical protein